MPSWRMVLLAVADAWRDRRDEIERQGAQIFTSLGATARLEPSTEPIREESLSQAVATAVSSHDAVNGGWGEAPKFPQAMVIELLLARGEIDTALAALRAMAHGGIYDQVGGGFARYSVDATWTVPHFEKMLYDNALLARAYLHAWQVSGEALMGRVCTETLDWALRELRGPEGGFCSALDADSEGVEGKFYVWTDEELRTALGELYEPAIEFFQPRPFEHGARVLEGRGPVPDRLPEIRGKLFGARAERVRPGLDDKRLTAWNGLMITALAEAGAALGRPAYVDAAVKCAEFLESERRAPDGRLLRTPQLAGYLDDHAYLVEALLALYEATLDPRWYRGAAGLADEMIARFADPERGGFFTTAADQSDLPVRRKDLEDSPIPSGNSSAAVGLLRLAALSGEHRYEEQAEGVLALLFPLAVKHPLAFGHLLRAADFHLASVREVAIVGPEPEPLLAVVRGMFRPHIVLAGGSGGGVPLLEGREPIDGRAAAYVCERFSCQAPVTEPAELEARLTPAPAAA
jgi:uncharacterized protein YyaL (SSP411 family)